MAVIGYVLEWGVSKTGSIAIVGRHYLCPECAWKRSHWMWLRFHNKDPQGYLDEDCEPSTKRGFRCEDCGKERVSEELLMRAFGGGHGLCGG